MVTSLVQNGPRAAGCFSALLASFRINLGMLVARAWKNSQLTCGDVTISETVH
jgi:hypothetical protein